jgi:hypothetical protein
MVKRIWSDPVWSKVIASVIVALIGAVVSYLAGWWPIIMSVLDATCRYLVATTMIRNWMFLILLLCAGLFVLTLSGAAWIVLTGKKSKEEYKIYKTDRILDLVWRWRYDSSGEIISLGAFCPKCDMQLAPQSVPDGQGNAKIVYLCDDCGDAAKVFPGILIEVESLVKRHIQKRLRSGNWRGAVRS